MAKPDPLPGREARSGPSACCTGGRTTTPPHAAAGRRTGRGSSDGSLSAPIAPRWCRFWCRLRVDFRRSPSISTQLVQVPYASEKTVEPAMDRVLGDSQWLGLIIPLWARPHGSPATPRWAASRSDWGWVMDASSAMPRTPGATLGGAEQGRQAGATAPGCARGLGYPPGGPRAGLGIGAPTPVALHRPSRGRAPRVARAREGLLLLPRCSCAG